MRKLHLLPLPLKINPKFAALHLGLGLVKIALMQAVESQSRFTGRVKILLAWPGILLSLLWLYMFGWAIFIVVNVFRPNAGRLELEDWVLAGADLLPLILIPAYLIHCARRNQPPRLRPWWPWVARLVYVSFIFAMCDCWAFAERGAPVFMHETWRTRGYTFGGIGFGYLLTCHRDADNYGPEVWFWFTPFTISLTTQNVGFQWFW